MSHHSARKLLSSPFVPNCRFGKLKRFRTATRPCCARMDVAAVTRGVVNMWVWLKSLQLCCSASATPTFCVTQSAEIGPAAAGPAGPAPMALHTQPRVRLGAAREAGKSITMPKSSTYKYFLQYAKWFTEARTPNHNSL